MNEKELERKFRIFENQIMQLQEQLGAIERGINDLSSINSGLDELKGKIGEEVYAPIGRGIFMKSTLASENLKVDIGDGTFVEKNIPETKKMITEQIEKLKDIQGKIELELDRVNGELTETMRNYQEEMHAGHEHSHEHKHSRSCDCGDDCDCSKDDDCGCGHQH